MSRQVKGRAAPWVGSVALHIVFIAVLAAAALRWRSDPQPQQLAVEGNVVRYEDLPASVRAGKPLRESPPPEVQQPAAPVQSMPEPAPPQPEPQPVDDSAQRQAAAEAQQKLEQERIALEQRQAEERRVAEEKRAQEEAQRLQAAEEQKRLAAEAEARRKADEQRKQQEALAAQQKAEQEKAAQEKAAQEKAAKEKAAQEKAAREAKQRAEADLQRALASEEEEGEAMARSGVVDEYKALLTQTIERNWNKPETARPGLECTLYVTQAPGGMVMDVKLGACNGDDAVRESIKNAVYRSSPLPAPRDPRAFQRQLVMVFKPKE